VWWRYKEIASGKEDQFFLQSDFSQSSQQEAKEENSRRRRRGGGGGGRREEIFMRAPSVVKEQLRWFAFVGDGMSALVCQDVDGCWQG
jgi:hypothetical protein